MQITDDFLDRLTKQGHHEVTIEPEQAKALLTLNTRNRRIKTNSVKWLTSILLGGHWKLTNDALVVDWNGDLANGQHRLLACVEANMPIHVYLMTGADPAIRDVLDTGPKRSFSDTLTMRGHVDARLLAASATLHHKYLDAVNRGAAFTGLSQVAVDQLKLIEHINAYPEIQGMVPAADQLRRQFHGSGAAWCAFMAMIADLDGYDDFMDGLRSGAGLGAGDARLALRNYLIRREPVRASKLLGLLCKSWNLWIDRREVQLLSLKGSEPLQVPR